MKKNWKIKTIKTIKVKKGILILGFPGIANVGKICINFLIESKKLKPIAEFSSYTLSSVAFINEKNLVSLPKIFLYYFKTGNKNYFLLSGDAQPQTEQGVYEFCELILDYVKKAGVSEVITLAGIGLQNIPQKPKLYITGNNPKLIKKYASGWNISNKLYGFLGYIGGISGVLLGMNKIPGVSILAETFANPMYIGMKGAQQILEYLNNKLNLKLDLKDLDKEIAELEEEMLLKPGGEFKEKTKKDISYIG